jgi:hypothetical protein
MPRPYSCIRGCGPKAREHVLTLLVREPAEVELVVVAQERRPLRRVRAA